MFYDPVNVDSIFYLVKIELMSGSNHNNSSITKEDLTEAIGGLAAMVQQEFVSVNKRLDSIGSDVAELKTDVAELKTDVAELKQVTTDLKQTTRVLVGDVAEIKVNMEEQEH